MVIISISNLAHGMIIVGRSRDVSQRSKVEATRSRNLMVGKYAVIQHCVVMNCILVKVRAHPKLFEHKPVAMACPVNLLFVTMKFQ